MALLGWTVAAWMCRPHDRWVGWARAQQWARLRYVANNARSIGFSPPDDEGTFHSHDEGGSTDAVSTGRPKRKDRPGSAGTCGAAAAEARVIGYVGVTLVSDVTEMCPFTADP